MQGLKIAEGVFAISLICAVQLRDLTVQRNPEAGRVLNHFDSTVSWLLLIFVVVDVYLPVCEAGGNRLFVNKLVSEDKQIDFETDKLA